MNIRSKSPRTPYNVLVHIDGIGFIFEVNQYLKHNLISPDVLAFFDGVQECGEVTADCAFPISIPNTNLRQSIFQYIGNDWAVCSDGIFRKCQKVKCEITIEDIVYYAIFYIDNSLVELISTFSNVLRRRKDRAFPT